MSGITFDSGITGVYCTEELVAQPMSLYLIPIKRRLNIGLRQRPNAECSHVIGDDR